MPILPSEQSCRSGRGFAFIRETSFNKSIMWALCPCGVSKNWILSRLLKIGKWEGYLIMHISSWNPPSYPQLRIEDWVDPWVIPIKWHSKMSRNNFQLWSLIQDNLHNEFIVLASFLLVHVSQVWTLSKQHCLFSILPPWKNVYKLVTFLF